MNRTKIATAVALLSLLGSTGCLLNRSIARIEDNPDKHAMILETIDTRVTPLAILTGFISSRHQFWVCEEREANALECSQTCGGASGLECPEFLYLTTTVVTHTADNRTGVAAPPVPAPEPAPQAIEAPPAPEHEAVPASAPAPAPVKKAKKRK
jgi:hypothetical protein